MQENLLGDFCPEHVVFNPSSAGRLPATACALFLALVVWGAAWALKGFLLREQQDVGWMGRIFWTPEPVRDCRPVIPNAV